MPLFEALSQLDSGFKFIGTSSMSRKAKLLGALGSISSTKERTRQLLEFSPSVANSLEKSCIALLDKLDSKPEAVLYWGATNLPVGGKYSDLPYSIITDGPYDPDDPIYPDIWQPGRWQKQYLDLQHRVFTGATQVFTLSEWARQKVIKVHGLDPSRVTKIGWGPLYCIGPAIERPTEGKKIILSVGHHWYLKGMDLVAAAGAQLASERDDVETIIIGDPHGLDIAPSKGVTLIPHSMPIAEVHEIMRRAAVLVVASRFDASPHIIPEALQYGVPVVGSNVCGIPEAIVGKPSCRVIGTGKDDLAKVLEECLSPNNMSSSTSKNEEIGWEKPASNLSMKMVKS
jgi:glycosyltransferase involved in cell wall biosynthesis